MADRPLNVLALASFYPRADAPNFGVFVERQWQAFAARAGCSVTVIAPVGTPPFPLSRLGRYASLRSLPGYETWRGLNVHRPRFRIWPAMGAAGNAAALARAVIPLARQLDRHRRFDIVAADFLHPDAAAAQRLAAALALPFTVKARGADVHHWGTIPAVREQIRAAADAAGAILAVSGALADDLAALGVPRERITVHPTGCDLERFHPADRPTARDALDLPGGGPLIVSVGALIPRKRHALLVEALVHLPAARLAIAGTGPEDNALRRQAARLGVAHRVHMLGSVAHDALPRLLVAADVMALVSRSEGLANAWVEALACGTPIVISDAGGARALLTDPVAGRIVAPDPMAIAEAIATILADPPAPALVRATVQDMSWERQAEALEAILRHTAGR